MATFGPASIVVVPFPFSDLSGTKLRPAVILAQTGQEDWLLCQITSNPYMDATAVRLTNTQLSKGSLNTVSFVRPMKLFTAHTDLIVKRIALVNAQTFKEILTGTIEGLQKNMPA